MLLTKLPDGPDGVVGRAVVYQKNIIFILLQVFHFFLYLRNHMGKRMLRAVTGNYKADFFIFVPFSYSVMLKLLSGFP